MSTLIKDSDRLTYRLNLLSRLAIEANDQIFRDKTGLSILEIRVLRLVDDNPGITFVELNKVVHLERSKTSRLIQSLVKAGLLARVNDSSDARRFALHCTAEGRALRNRARALADGLERGVQTCEAQTRCANRKRCKPRFAVRR